MPSSKSIRVRNNETNTETWEDFDDFQVKGGGKANHEKALDKIKEAIEEAQIDATVKTLFLDIIKLMKKA